MGFKSICFLSAFLSFGAFAAGTGESYFVDLHCSAKATPPQPCGGTNTRDLKLTFSKSQHETSSGYREDVFYGGCYSTSSSEFGVVGNVVKDGDTFRFELRRSGFFAAGDIPVVYQFHQAEPEKPVSAALDLKTSVLTLDTSSVSWMYKEPSVLQCQPL